ncbi:MAG TPA: beta-ketoacyl synthase N-terminal-like domain-containing protein [Candidatus Polarisedimenticolia bacterium]|nr:beta-ketoacyl synthase N-terminal-like domain-containing protein [Candidatus Polarisedimenticolia bacterium]
METPRRPRIGIFGWGVVAPRSAGISEFRENLRSNGSWMEPFEGSAGFGPNNFLVGVPSFDIEQYRPWIEQRFKPARFSQFVKHSGGPVRYAVGAFIQALEQNPGIEKTLQDLGQQAHIYLGTGVGDLPTLYDVSVEYYKAQRRWNRFWGSPDRCRMRELYEASAGGDRERLRAEFGIPPHPEQLSDADPSTRDAAEEAWEAFWCARSESLLEYLEEARRIQSEGLAGDIESSKERVIKRKLTEMRRLNARYGCPPEPWVSVHPNLIWNIHNAPAAQVSMMGRIQGDTFAPVGACSSFGLALKLAIDAIRAGQARAVVVGMTDPAPHPLLVGAFYKANVLAADASPSKPLAGLKGTHVAGGACVWIVADADYMREHGYRPVGLEIAGVGLSSDAHHIITPTRHGPVASIDKALADARIAASDIAAWDLHATATPGDWLEVSTALDVLPATIPMSARKGSFGHGMSVGGAWELTAQHLGAVEGLIYPTILRREELNESIAQLGGRFVFDEPVALSGSYVGKINMGVGGINACVISRKWED